MGGVQRIHKLIFNEFMYIYLLLLYNRLIHRIHCGYIKYVHKFPIFLPFVNDCCLCQVKVSEISIARCKRG